MTDKLLRNFTHITIPSEIWMRRDISIQAKALWAELRSLHDKEVGGCYASDEYLMEFMGLKRSRLHEVYKELKDSGLMEVVFFDGRRTIRRAIVPDVEYIEKKENQESGKPESGQQLSGKPDTSNPENRTPPIRKTGFSPYIDIKEENKDKNIFAQTAPRLRTNDPEISFSFDKKKFENISTEDIQNWKEIYNSIDVTLALKEMVQWILANPSKAKSKKLWRKFIVGWLQRANEKSTNSMAYLDQKSKTQRGEVISRHTGFQKDNTPRDPRKILDFSDCT